MTSEPAPAPMSEGEARALADHLAAWADTLTSRQRQALGEILARAAVAPLNGLEPAGFRGRLLPDPTYDLFFARLQEVAPDLTVPDA